MKRLRAEVEAQNPTAPKVYALCSFRFRTGLLIRLRFRPVAFHFPGAYRFP